VREAAAQSLGLLGDDRAVPGLLALLAGGVAAAVEVPGQPHLVQPYDAVLEALGSLGATEAIGVIEAFTAHPLAKVQYAAVRAMYQLTGDGAWGDRLVTALQGPDLQLRRAVMGDVGAIGYLAGASAIAQTQAENSLKLIALKSLIEHPNATPDGQTLTDDGRHILALMDGLL
jgi:phycocyanobilin lyase alpha subunit